MAFARTFSARCPEITNRIYSYHSVLGANSYSTAVNQTTSLLRNLHNGAEVYLVGTAHVSKASADQVKEMIHVVRPQTVMVELDADRAQRLRSGESWLQQVLKGGLPGVGQPGMLLGLGIGAMYEFLKMFGMEPGLEFKVAIEEAEKAHARILYGDQDAKQTMQRLQQSLDMGKLMQLMMANPSMSSLDLGKFSSFSDLIEGMKTRATTKEITDKLRTISPEAVKALLDDRDEYMANVLLRQKGRVVGVVGLAHLDGIERRWQAAMRQSRIAS